MEHIGYHQMKNYMHYKNLTMKRVKGTERIFKEITAENFPNMGKEMDINIEAQMFPNRVNPKRARLRYNIIICKESMTKIFKSIKK